MSGGRPGWYPDPLGRFEQRYHNGSSWTADVAIEGRRAVDPAGVGPNAAGTWGPTAPRPRNGAAVASMVCGIVAAALGWLPFIAFATLVLALVAIGLGVRGRRRSGALGGSGHGQAVAGLSTGAAGLASSALGIALTFLFTAAFDRYEHPARHEVDIRRCAADVEVAITNLDDRPADFAVLVSVERSTGRDGAERIELDDVDAGSTSIVTSRLDGREARCFVQVDGPLPWGIDPEDFES